mgnify:CR=1 FL=1
MKICIVGAGSIGGLLACRLAINGHTVSIVARGAHLEQIKKNGITLHSEGRTEIAPVLASSFVPDEPQDFVFITTKSTAVRSLASQIKTLSDNGATIIPAMNGVPHWYFYKIGNKWENCSLSSVDPDGTLKTVMPFKSIIGTVVYPACEIVAPGIVKHISGNRFSLSEPNGIKSDRVTTLSSILNSSGFRAPISRNIRDELWIKLWGNLAFNPISCLTGGTLREICDDSNIVEIVRRIMQEAKEVGEKIGVNFPITIEKRIAGAAAVGDHKTSMLQDLELGRAMEIDSIVSAVQELGELVKVKTPTIDIVLNLLKQRAKIAGCY